MTDSERDENVDKPREDDLGAAGEENTETPEEATEVSPELQAEINEALADVDPAADGDGEVTDLEAQLAERTEDLQRVTAEYANYRKRTERERAAIVEQAKAKVMEKLLPILDDLDLADQHGDLKEGPLKAFADKFKGIVDTEGLVAFGAEGDEFDPERHEAVQDLSEGDEKVLGTVLRKGYTYRDRLVRTAMVIIADPAE